MLGYTARRLLVAIPLLLAVVLSTFLLLYALPGDATHALLGNQWTPEKAAEIRKAQGLDDPLPVQFFRYLGMVLTGDLGVNHQQEPVAHELATRLPATIELAVAALLLATVAGVTAGVVSALRPRGLRDMALLAVAMAGVSLPIFWLGLLMQRLLRRGGLLSQTTGFPGLPLGGRLSEAMTQQIDQAVLRAQVVDGQPLMMTGLHIVDALLVFGDPAMFGDALLHLLLPAMVLATVPMAMIARITRTAVGEQLSQDYVRTAHAKGAPPRRVIVGHVLRNAAIPIVTSIGSQLGYLLGGAVLTETIFNWPGMGTYIVDAILREDARPLQAGVLIMACGFILINLAVDLSYAAIDPRIRER